MDSTLTQRVNFRNIFDIYYLTKYPIYSAVIEVNICSNLDIVFWMSLEIVSKCCDVMDILVFAIT